MIDEASAVACALREVREQRVENTRMYLRLHEIDADDPDLVASASRDRSGAWLVYLRIAGRQYLLRFLIKEVDGHPSVEEVRIAPRVRVLLTVESAELTPGEITGLIGISPTRTVAADDAVPRRASPPLNLWRFEPRPVFPDDVEDQLERLLDELRPVGARIAALPADCVVRVSVVYLGWRGDAQFGGWVLSPAVTAALSSLGASLEFDLYALGPAPDQETDPPEDPQPPR